MIISHQIKTQVPVTESREEITSYIKERADIVEIIGEHVNLRRSGVRYLGLCPFHHEKTPSFSVHAGQQFFYCFGCGESGDVFSFMMKYHNLDFPGALKLLAERYQVRLPEKRRSAREQERDRRRKLMFELNRKVAGYFREHLLSTHGAEARSYLLQRGIGPEIQEKFYLGFTPPKEMGGWNFLGSRLKGEERELAIEVGLLVQKEAGGTYDRFRGRIQFPIFDAQGRIAGFGGRTITDDPPKYMNSPESLIYNKSRMLFGLYQQRQAIGKQRRAVLVEGNFDLLALVAGGFEPVVAPLGTALTSEQVRRLKPMADEVVLFFDGDSAGVKAAERAAPFFLAEQVSARVALLPETHDPDSFIREKGLDAVEQLIGKAKTLAEFVVHQLMERHGLSLDGKTKILEALTPLMNSAASNTQRSLMAAHFSKILGIDPEMLMAGSRKRDTAVQAPREEPILHARRDSVRTPVDGPLKSLVGYAVLNPHNLNALNEAGLQEVLAGSIGEVIVIQLALLREKKNDQLQPEDLLTALPDGEERSLVASILKEANKHRTLKDELVESSDELTEFLGWLERKRLQKESDRIISLISQAQKDNNFEEISRLLQEKLKIDGKIKG